MGLSVICPIFSCSKRETMTISGAFQLNEMKQVMKKKHRKRECSKLEGY
jgi:hypothetical protein